MIIVLFACNLTQVLCDLLSKTYLAQMAYVDTAIVSFTRVWHAEQGDDAEVVAQRNRELADVAAALRLVEGLEPIAPPRGVTEPRTGRDGGDLTMGRRTITQISNISSRARQPSSPHCSSWRPACTSSHPPPASLQTPTRS